MSAECAIRSIADGVLRVLSGAGRSSSGGGIGWQRVVRRASDGCLEMVVVGCGCCVSTVSSRKEPEQMPGPPPERAWRAMQICSMQTLLFAASPLRMFRVTGVGAVTGTMVLYWWL